MASASMPTFHAVGDEIFVRRGDEVPVKTLKVVGGSFSTRGLANEISDILNRHYGNQTP